MAFLRRQSNITFSFGTEASEGILSLQVSLRVGFLEFNLPLSVFVSFLRIVSDEMVPLDIASEK